jgi:predicted alternative tryptophan synthase beta-subunit
MKQNYDKESAKFYKQAAKDNGVKFITSESGIESIGFTVAYAQDATGEDARMLQVAVSYCAPEDKFSKKVGRYQAAMKLFDGEYVQLPLAKFHKEFGSTELKGVLSYMFDL